MEIFMDKNFIKKQYLLIFLLLISISIFMFILASIGFTDITSFFSTKTFLFLTFFVLLIACAIVSVKTHSLLSKIRMEYEKQGLKNANYPRQSSSFILCFTNKYAIVSDVVFVFLFLFSPYFHNIVIYFIKSPIVSDIVHAIIFALFILSIDMHFILNGKNFNYFLNMYKQKKDTYSHCKTASIIVWFVLMVLSGSLYNTCSHIFLKPSAVENTAGGFTVSPVTTLKFRFH
ncbi:MAG: hypothetical protein K0R90_597 [Oscillospiraceae bacterium]|jgi:hypothetical protein|nr:hypothetical protein [Oscillospiraceae bacterium]